MKKFHTIIVGAGPGGLACATLLAEAGREVLVLERNSLIGPKVCAGGIPATTMALGLPGALLEKSFASQRILSRWQQTRIAATEPIVSTINRTQLGRWMAQRAEAAGAVIQTDSLVLRIDSRSVTTREETIGYEFLVGADGSGSVVRRSLGLPSEKVGVGIHYLVVGDFAEMEWHLDAGLFGNGYAWIFPHQEQASIGVYAHRKTAKPAALLNGLHQWAMGRGISLNSRQPKAALINFDYRGWRFDRRFLVGDAAGLASGLTGEGIYSAIVSGEETAKSILDSTYKSERMTRLLRQHRRHCRLLELIPEHGPAAQLVLEGLVLALRSGLILPHELTLELPPEKIA